MKRNIDALFVINAISGGGAENSIMSISKRLVENGLNLHICALNSCGPNEIRNVQATNLHILQRNWKDGLIQTVWNFVLFRRLVRQLKPNYIIANCELPELYVALSAPKRTRIVAVEHTSNPWDGRKSLGRIVRLVLKRRNTYWITVSNTTEPIWFGSEQPKYIANPIESIDDEIVENPEAQELVFIGRLRTEKRPDWVIEVGIATNSSVYLFGDGEFRPQLEQTFLPGKDIHFMGFRRNPWSEISKNSLIVVPSDYEGDGMVIAEALISGRQVLLRDNLDLRRFKLPEANYFVDKHDLLTRITAWKLAGSNSLFAPPDLVRELKKVRDPKLIATEWLELLSTDDGNK